MPELPFTGIGTPILLLLAVLSILSIALIILKYISLSRATAGGTQRDQAFKALAVDTPQKARSQIANPRSPADRITVTALGEIEASRISQLETTLELAGNEEARHAFKHIRTLETIAMISPLLGLLGTVLGMIQAFRDLEMAEGAANAALLAGGIWQALLTTAAGLIVALPAAAGAALLSARAEAAVAEIETSIARILSALSSRSNR